VPAIVFLSVMTPVGKEFFLYMQIFVTATKQRYFNVPVAADVMLVLFSPLRSVDIR